MEIFRGARKITLGGLIAVSALLFHTAPQLRVSILRIVLAAIFLTSSIRNFRDSWHLIYNMSKRTADHQDDAPLKGGERPEQMDVDMDKDMGEFEDEFEDEFESEDEIIEAGVDGRPDAEREAEEKERE